MGSKDELVDVKFFVRDDDSDVNSIKKRLDIYQNMSKSIINFYSKKNLIYLIKEL